MKSLALLMVLLLLAALAFAQEVDLEALERKLKAEQARETKAQQADAARQAAQARQGQLVLRSDVDCALSIDGEVKAQLIAQQIQTVRVAPGQLIVECVATGVSTARYSAVHEIGAAAKLVVEIRQAAEVERARRLASIINPPMVIIPAGRFVMGSPDSEADRGEGEGPQRTVTVAAFELSKHEVTFAEWDACVADGGCSHTPGDQGWGRGSRPVINVSWEDTQGYIRWLSGKTGRQYRLPSEAEWEYAARAGTTTPWSTGASISKGQAQFSAQQTVPVGSFAANPWGLHDVHGNVWEWAQDCWHDTYAGAPTDGSVWPGGDCGRRVLRGGSWFGSLAGLRSALRLAYAPAPRGTDVGFRLARTL